MGASTGVIACRREARADANMEVGVQGIVSMRSGRGGGGGGGGGAGGGAGGAREGGGEDRAWLLESYQDFEFDVAE